MTDHLIEDEDSTLATQKVDGVIWRTRQKPDGSSYITYELPLKKLIKLGIMAAVTEKAKNGRPSKVDIINF